MRSRAFKLFVPSWFAVVLLLALLPSLVVWSVFVVCWCGNFRISYSPSVPLGIYRLDQRDVERGDYVMFCPPRTPVFAEALRFLWLAHGECSAGTRYMMKLVVAAEGDLVMFRDEGVFVNGRRVPNSARRTTDYRGVTLPRPRISELTLARDERVLMSLKGPDSFDSRYFGPITGQIVGRLSPIFTWEK